MLSETQNRQKGRVQAIESTLNFKIVSWTVVIMNTNKTREEIRALGKKFPGVYVTGNLHIPDCKRPFIAVINMLGHWGKGKSDKDSSQPLGHSLALNG